MQRNEFKRWARIVFDDCFYVFCSVFFLYTRANEPALSLMMKWQHTPENAPHTSTKQTAGLPFQTLLSAFRGCSFPPFIFSGSSVRGAKYVFATRSSNAVEFIPPENAITREPVAFSPFRLGPSGITFIEGSRDLRNRVSIRGKKHALPQKVSKRRETDICHLLAIHGVSNNNISRVLFTLDANLSFAIKFLAS